MAEGMEARTDDPSARIARGDLAGLEAWLTAGGDPAQADRWGVPLLVQAAARGALPMVECLLRHGAAPDQADGAGNVALMQACARGHLEIARALVGAGADPAVVNKWGFGCRDWANWPENGAELQALLREAAS